MYLKCLNNKFKREKIFTYLKQQQFSVCLLKETHLPSNNKSTCEDELGGIRYFSSVHHVILDYEDIVPGRLQAINISIENKVVSILNIYGPNENKRCL